MPDEEYTIIQEDIEEAEEKFVKSSFKKPYKTDLLPSMYKT